MKEHFYFLLIFLLFSSVAAQLFPEEELFGNNTLVLDIETSDYYDLVIWVNKLGIESTGNIEEIRDRLFTYYNIKPDPETNSSENTRSIIIKSAREVDYLNDISIDQDYVILKGEVLLEMIDPDNNASHKINADKVIFNQTEKTISAYGNIEYEIIRDKKNEYFHGESIVFEVETWEGIFFEGVSETTRKVEYEELSTTEEIPFLFSGDYIYRSSGDQVILNNGSITSSKKKEPYYRIDADKIWVLQPGEWAMKNAVLYVGRIPVLYFPFFFIPGDKFLFNLVVGSKEIEGKFVNTTTYLIGQKDEESSNSFSFLKSEDDTLMKRVRKGLFLTSSKENIDINSWPYSTDSSLKLYADFYSRKGFFIGLDGKLGFDAFLKEVNIFSAISLSKYIYLNNGIYTSFIKDSSGKYTTDYEKSYLFNQKFPFRFAFDIDLAVKNNWMSLDFKLPLYSDSKFKSHFMNREESFKWNEFLNSDDKELTVKENEDTSIDWKFAGKLNPSFKSFSPVVKNISLNKINMSLNWRSSVLNHHDQATLSLLNTNNYTIEDSLSFFYPTSLILPDISGTMSGTIFESSKSTTNGITEESPIEGSELLRDPWSIKNSVPSTLDSDLLPEHKLLEFIPAGISTESTFFTNKLKYSISPSMVLNTIFSSATPVEPDETYLNSDYSIFSTKTTSLLDYSFNIKDSFLSLSNILNFSMNYKMHYDSYQIEDSVWDSYRKQDQTATNYKVTNDIKVISKLFIKNEFLSESSLTYILNTTLYNGHYDNDYVNDYFKWNEDSISTHSSDIQLKYFDSSNYQIFNLKIIYPPKNPELNPEIILSSDHFTTSLKTGFKYDAPLYENSWSVDPYEGYIKYSFFDKDYLKQTVSIDTEEIENNFSRTELFIDKMESNITFKQDLYIDLYDRELQKSYTNLNLWFFYFNFLAEDTYAYDLQASGWVKETANTYFQPSNVSTGLNYSYKPDPFWKNRIKLSASINTSWTMNLLKYTDAALSFKPKITLEIAEFLKLSFESTSVNHATYLYIPGLVDEPKNLFTDLLKSFNFFNEKDRLNSYFNIESFNLNVVHHLSDWDLNFKYTGVLDLRTVDNIKEYYWKPEFSIFVIWKPVPEIKKNISYSDSEISFK